MIIRQSNNDVDLEEHSLLFIKFVPNAELGVDKTGTMCGWTDCNVNKLNFRLELRF